MMTHFKLFSPVINKKIRKYIVLIFMICIGNSCKAQAPVIDSIHQNALETKAKNAAIAAKQTIVHFVMENEEGTYGYAIFIDGNMAYRQPTIPAISGNKGFETVKQAENMAKYVIQKLKNGDNPPSVSPKEVENILSNQH